MDQIGTALGTGLNWAGQHVPQFLGGPQANWGAPFMPADPSAVGSAIGASGDPAMSPYFTGGTTTDPNAAVDPASVAIPAATAMGPTGGVGFNPAMATESAFTGLGGGTDPVTNAPLGSEALGGTPAAPGFWQSLFGGAGGGGGGGAPGGRSAWPSNLNLLAAGGVDLLKYLQQRQLLDPSAIEKATNQMAAKNAAALRKSIYPGVTAQLQETGNINAPYLAAQAYTTAIAPILAQQREAAMENWLRANAIALGDYPTDVGNPLGGFVSPNLFGGGYA